MPPRFFVNRDSGALAKIETGEEDGFVKLNILSPNPSHYSMPTGEYDTKFVDGWRPATLADLEAEETPFRLPRNAPEDWK